MMLICIQMAEQMSDPRLFCTHLPYSMMDPSIDEAKPKVSNYVTQERHYAITNFDVGNSH